MHVEVGFDTTVPLWIPRFSLQDYFQLLNYDQEKWKRRLNGVIKRRFEIINTSSLFLVQHHSIWLYPMNKRRRNHMIIGLEILFYEIDVTFENSKRNLKVLTYNFTTVEKPKNKLLEKLMSRLQISKRRGTLRDSRCMLLIFMRPGTLRGVTKDQAFQKVRRGDVTRVRNSWIRETWFPEPVWGSTNCFAAHFTKTSARDGRKSKGWRIFDICYIERVFPKSNIFI